MYILKKDNIEKVVDNEIACNQLICDGFKVLEVEEESKLDMSEEENKEENEIDLNSMTLEELKAIAKEKGIEKYSSMKKGELIEKLG